MKDAIADPGIDDADKAIQKFLVAFELLLEAAPKKDLLVQQLLKYYYKGT